MPTKNARRCAALIEKLERLVIEKDDALFEEHASAVNAEMKAPLLELRFRQMVEEYRKGVPVSDLLSQERALEIHREMTLEETGIEPTEEENLGIVFFHEKAAEQFREWLAA